MRRINRVLGIEYGRELTFYFDLWDDSTGRLDELLGTRERQSNGTDMPIEIEFFFEEVVAEPKFDENLGPFPPDYDPEHPERSITL